MARSAEVTGPAREPAERPALAKPSLLFPLLSPLLCPLSSLPSPLSSFETCFCLDQNVFLLDYHDSICCHIVNGRDWSAINELVSSSRHHYPPGLYWFLCLKPSWSINLEEIPHSQVLVMNFRLDSSRCQQRVTVHSWRNWQYMLYWFLFNLHFPCLCFVRKMDLILLFFIIKRNLTTIVSLPK